MKRLRNWHSCNTRKQLSNYNQLELLTGIQSGYFVSVNKLRRIVSFKCIKCAALENKLSASKIFCYPKMNSRGVKNHTINIEGTFAIIELMNNQSE